MKKYCIVLLIFLLTACQQTAENSAKPIRFFDLKAYFSEQITENQKYTGILKTVSIDGEEESKKIQDIDWKEDLNVFVRADINKPAWQDKYNTATSTVNGQKVVTYTTENEKLITKKITISYKADAIDNIIIEQKNDNEVYQAEKTLTYRPGKGYSIKSKQKAPFSGEHDYEVKVVFQN